MFHPFEYLKSCICTNIVHINHRMNSCNFCTNLWKSDFVQNLHQPMKLSNFVMNGKLNLYYKLFKFG